MKKYVPILLFLLVLIFFIYGCNQKNTTQEKTIIVKQSSGASMLIAECSDKNYISEQADYIVEGIIQKIETKQKEGNIVTYSDLSVEKYIKGSSLGDKIQIETPGGCINEICQAVEDQPIFEQGKRVRIYFHKTETEFWIVCAQLGVEEIL